MGLFGPPNINKMRTKQDVKGLIKALDYKKDLNIQQSAAWALGEIGDQRAVEPLIAVFNLWSNGNDVSEVAKALTKIGGAEVIEFFIETLKHEDWKVRRAAIQSLGNLKDKNTVEPLLAVLFDEKEGPSVKVDAIQALAKMGDTRATKPLLDIIVAVDNQRRSLAVYVGKALVALNDKNSIDPLLSILQTGDNSSRYQSASILDGLGWRPGRDEIGAYYWIAKQDLQTCAAIGSPAVKPLTEALKDGEVGIRITAIEMLGRLCGKSVFELIKDVVNDSDSEVRKTAIEILANSEDERVVDLLSAKISDRSTAVRIAVVDALEKIGSDQALEIIMKARTDDKAKVRQSVIKALGRHANQQMVLHFITALEDNDAQVQFLAIQALSKLKDARAVKPLLNLIKKNTHLAAIQVTFQELGSLAVQPLIDALGDREISRFAISQLGNIGDPRAFEPLMHQLEVGEKKDRLAVLKALSNFTEFRAVESVISLLNDDDKEVRLAAIKVLVKSGDCQAVEWFANMLNDDQTDIRKAAAYGLAQFGDARGTEPLLKILAGGDYEDRIKAIHGLGMIGDPNTFIPLMQKLSDGKKEIRQAAAVQLVHFYKTGKLTDEQKNLIISNRNLIQNQHRDTTSQHTDKSVYPKYHVDKWCYIVNQHSDSGGKAHTDQGGHSDNNGIGVEFPL